MLSGTILDRNNAGRNSQGPYGKQNDHRNRNLKLNIGKDGANSMLKSEKERQRQEARAQREKTRAGASAPQEKNEAIFGVVQVSPTPGQDKFQISDILGDFTEVAKSYKSRDLIGVDPQPQTPAPVPSAHIHDPDNYFPPPPAGPVPGSVPRGDQRHPHGHRPSNQAGARPRPQPPPAPPTKFPYHTHQKFVEEVRPSLKSGPGPGPGPGNRPHHRDHGGGLPGAPGPGGQLPPMRSHDRPVKDPQVMKIMSEMNDLKSPLSAMLQTPRPDHQSSFTFPAPISSSLGAPEPGRGPLPPSNLKPPQNAFHPAKSRKSSDSRVTASAPSKSNSLKSSSKLNSSYEFNLSEDSDDELKQVLDVPKTKNGESMGSRNPPRVRSPPVALEGSKPPISPMKNTDESSNSEDTSGTDSESSSSEEEAKPPSPPPSPLPSDSNHWSLEKIFNNGNQSSNKDDSGGAENGNKVAAESCKDPVADFHPGSPHNVEGPAPPVVTTVPEVQRKTRVKKSASSSRRAHVSKILSSDDEAFNEEVRQPPKPQKRVKTHSGDKSVPKSRLSSDSEDELSLAKSRKQLISPSRVLSSPRVRPKVSAGTPKTKSPSKRQSVSQTKPSPYKNTNSDSESDEFVDVLNSSPDKALSSKTSTIRKPQTPVKSSRQKNVPRKEQGSPPPRSRRLSGLSPEHPVPESKKQKHPKKAEKFNEPVVPVIKPSKDRRKVAKDSSAERSPAKEPRQSKRSSKTEEVPPPPPSPSKSHRKRHHSKTRDENINNLFDDADIKGKTGVKETLSPKHLTGNENVSKTPPVAPVWPSKRKHERHKTSEPSGKPLNIPDLQYENGVARLLCSIPINLIDNLPMKVVNNDLKGCLKEEKISKEVLEMRTSAVKNSSISNSNNNVGHCNVNSVNDKNASASVKKRDDSRSSSSSPPNEDETKIRAICSIYRKRPSSVEPDRMKREMKAEGAGEGTPLGKASPLAQPKIEDAALKTESRLKEEPRSTPTNSSSSTSRAHKRRDSTSSLSSVGTNASVSSSRAAKKLKKEKRREKKEKERAEREHIAKKEREREKKVLEDEKLAAVQTKISPKKEKRSPSPGPGDVVPSRKRAREDGSCGPSNSKTAKLRPSTRAKNLFDDDAAAGSPARDFKVEQADRDSNEEFPHPRGPSEDRCSPVAPSRRHHPAGSQFSPDVGYGDGVGSSHSSRASATLQVNDYLDHDSEEYATQMEESESQELDNYHHLRREKVEEIAGGANPSGDTSEYHSLPSSEHGGSSAYRSGEERVSPPFGFPGPGPQHHLDMCAPVMMPMVPGFDYHHNSLMFSQDVPMPNAPLYMSYFDRRIPEILKDNTQYLHRAKELKHLADKERHKVLQTIIYLEAVLYFILTGESMECDPSNFTTACTMFNDTFKLIRHVSLPMFKSLGDKKDPNFGRMSIVLAILSLRCQSLLSLKLYKMKRPEIKEAQMQVGEYLKGLGRQSTPSQPVATPSSSWAAPGSSSQRSTANHSPSSLSPTPSPAGSVGSEGSQSSSGYSTEGARGHSRHLGAPGLMGTTPPQCPGAMAMPADVQGPAVRFCNVAFHLYNAYEMWQEADDHTIRNGFADFFVELDRFMGPLTLHSSLRDLVKYVQRALDRLKKSIIL